MPKETTPLFDLPCVIFAGGKSSRMGRNKALLPFGNAPTLALFQYARLAPLFSSVVLSVKSADGFPEGVPLIFDEPSVSDYAPTAGFVSAFHALDAERIFVLSVDTPFVDASVIAALLAADREDLDAVIARTETDMHPMCGIYHRRLLARFETMAAAGDHKLGSMLQRSRVRFIDFEDDAPFANLNHPHEYEAACRRLKEKQL